MRTRSTAGLAVTLFGLLASAGMAQGITPVRHAAEFRASTFTASAQEDAALAVAPDGSFAVVWASRRQQQGRYGVYLQRFDRAGVAIGQETPLNLWTTSQATAPVVAAGSDGGAWAAWQSHRQDGSRGAVIARRFGADGADAPGARRSWSTSAPRASRSPSFWPRCRTAGRSLPGPPRCPASPSVSRCGF